MVIKVKSIKALVISDVHGGFSALKSMVERVGNVDIVLFCGDATPYGRVMTTLDAFKELADILKDYRVLAVPGNMDNYSEIESVDKIGSLEIVHGKYVEINDIVIAGVGGSTPTPFGTPFELSEDVLESILARFRSIEGDRLVLLSHAPPYGTKCDIVVSGEHVGSKAIRKFVEEVQPLAVVCGHIHEARAIDKLGRTLIVNPGPASKGMYAILTIARGYVEAELLRI